MISFFKRGYRNGAGLWQGRPMGYVSMPGLALTERLEPRQLLSANLLVNPDFSAGNTGFSSQYGTGTKPSQYVIARNPASVYPGVISFGPPTGTGMQLLANGSTSGTKFVYHETVRVTKNTTYDFSGLVTTFAQTGNDHTDPSPARLSFYVNSAGIGTFKVPATDGKFGRFANLWNSGSSTTASIEIVDRNTASNGNDFALDNLSFAASPSLLVNGDFSAGYVGFSTQYIKGLKKPLGYFVTKDPASVYSGVVPFGPPGGTGLQLLANGATSGSPYIWQESVSVAKNTSYQFSGLAAAFAQLGNDHTDPSPAKLAFYVNGKPVGGFNVRATDGMFGAFSATWNSGNSTGATIKIVDLNHAASGNDFVLDHLAFNLL
jgi:hypothetical protein